MRVLILGGDGYLGWPTAMHLSARGHQVMAVDSYLRRELSRKCRAEPLYETPNLHDRADLWEEVSKHRIQVAIGDLCQWGFISSVFSDFAPEAVVHYAEQPSAPFSMLVLRF